MFSLNNIIKKGLICFLILVFVFVSGFSQNAFAGRSKAGGGEAASFDVGKWALGTAVGLGSFSLGSALGAGIGNIGTQTGFGKAFADNLVNLESWATNYNIVIATDQTSGALGRMGQYYGWDPKATLVASSVVGGMVGGGLNPAQFGAGIGALEGIGLGAIEGVAEGGVLAATANSKGEVPPWAGPVAGLAGGAASGFLVGGLTSNYNTKNADFSFGNTFTPGNALGTAVFNTIKSIPTRAISVGVGYMTENMDKQDRYIVQQAFSGVYPVVGTVSSIGTDVLQKQLYGKVKYSTPREPDLYYKTPAGAAKQAPIITEIPLDSSYQFTQKQIGGK